MSAAVKYLRNLFDESNIDQNEFASIVYEEQSNVNDLLRFEQEIEKPLPLLKLIEEKTLIEYIVDKLSIDGTEAFINAAQNAKTVAIEPSRIGDPAFHLLTLQNINDYFVKVFTTPNPFKDISGINALKIEAIEKTINETAILHIIEMYFSYRFDSFFDSYMELKTYKDSFFDEDFNMKLLRCYLNEFRGSISKYLSMIFTKYYTSNDIPYYHIINFSNRVKEDTSHFFTYDYFLANYLTNTLLPDVLFYMIEITSVFVEEFEGTIYENSYPRLLDGFDTLPLGNIDRIAMNLKEGNDVFETDIIAINEALGVLHKAYLPIIATLIRGSSFKLKFLFDRFVTEKLRCADWKWRRLLYPADLVLKVDLSPYLEDFTEERSRVLQFFNNNTMDLLEYERFSFEVRSVNKQREDVNRQRMKHNNRVEHMERQFVWKKEELDSRITKRINMRRKAKRIKL